MVEKTTIKRGTVLYHGTDCDDFVEADDSLNGPAWLSSSKDVARHFATRSNGWGGHRRIVAYRLPGDIALYEILSDHDLQALSDEHQLGFSGVEDMRDSVEASGIPGWCIPYNYPDGDDILIVDTSGLEYIETVAC